MADNPNNMCLVERKKNENYHCRVSAYISDTSLLLKFILVECLLQQYLCGVHKMCLVEV